MLQAVFRKDKLYCCIMRQTLETFSIFRLVDSFYLDKDFGLIFLNTFSAEKDLIFPELIEGITSNFFPIH